MLQAQKLAQGLSKNSSLTLAVLVQGLRGSNWVVWLTVTALGQDRITSHSLNLTVVVSEQTQIWAARINRSSTVHHLLWHDMFELSMILGTALCNTVTELEHSNARDENRIIALG